MRSFLHPDAPAYRLLTRWFELAVLSLGWWLLAAPLVTAPAATDWLVDAVRRTGAGEPVPGPRATLRQVRGRFVVTGRLGLVHLGVAALMMVAVLGPSPSGPWGTVVIVVAVGVAVTWSLIAPWSVVLLDDSVRHALRRCYVRALSHLSAAFLSAVAVIGGAALVVLAPGVVRLPVLLTVPALVALVVTRLADGAAPDAVSHHRPDPVPAPVSVATKGLS